MKKSDKIYLNFVGTPLENAKTFDDYGFKGEVTIRMVIREGSSVDAFAQAARKHMLQNPDTAGAKRLATEFKKLQASPIPEIAIKDHDDNQGLWTIIITGPTGSPYEGMNFEAEMHFRQYPFNAPIVRFKQKVFNPNIFEDQLVFLPILSKQFWNPAKQILNVFKELLVIFMTPTAECNANPEAAQLLKDDKVKFITRVKDQLRIDLQMQKEDAKVEDKIK